VAIGDRLHIACVTAFGDLGWGAALTYELRLDGAGLFEPGVVAASEAEARARLTYAGGPERPGFTTPPASVENLELFFGSCRRIHNSGHGDALAALDEVGPDRPDALLLVGDQIYADSLSPPVLDRTVALGAELLGWREILPGLDLAADEIPADARRHVNRSYVGHPEPAAVQLYGLGELCAVYLMALSDAVWPGDLDDTHRRFVDGLVAVRRAMANTACYMSFDDHEVTDDWNLTWEWCQRVYSRPLGRRMVRNGLIAHALFQAWGNDPAQYRDGAPGARLLEAIDGHCGASLDVDRLLSIPAIADLDGREGELPRAPEAIDWSFRLEAPGYDLAWLDTRTRRRYPGFRARPELLSPCAIDEQLGFVTGEDADRPLLVISAPPLADYALGAIGRLTHYLYYWVAGRGEGYRSVYGPDRGDLWRSGSDGLEALLARLIRRREVIALSGDTHCAYAVKTSAEGSAILGAVSSGLCREDPRTLLQHRRGYAYPLPLSRALPDEVYETAAGWRYRVRYLRADHGPGPGAEIVGRNNIGQLTFARDGAGQLIASLSLWYRESAADRWAPRTVFDVAVTPDVIE
jgi:hypothetical protein